MAKTSANFVMALDVGAASVKGALVDGKGKLHHVSARPAPPAGGTQAVAQAIAGTCRDVLGRAGLKPRDCLAVGCCTPGCVDPDTGIIVASASPGWLGVEFRNPLEEFLGRAVTVEGDGAAAVQAAYALGPARGQDQLLAITVGSGISCGYIVGGDVLRGYGKAALEAGHLPLFPAGRPCSCGLRGCWEAHAGGGAMAKLLQEYRAAGHPLPESPQELAELAAGGNHLARSIWEEQGHLLGIGIAALLNVLNPRMVVLGGALLAAWPLLRKPLLKSARQHALGCNSQAAIVCAREPEKLVLLGAAVAAVRRERVKGFFVDFPWEV